MKQIIAGILAHVDAGKTTLSEALLYSSGSIKKIGRVDNGDTFLDTDAMEKKRGITIFSKQAELQFGDTKMTLLDTPGHVDFSAEMERTLMVLDYAVLDVYKRQGVTYLKLISFMYLLPAVTNGIQGYFRGIGDLKITLISSMVNMGVRVLAAFVFVFGFAMKVETFPFACLAGWIAMLITEVPLLVRSYGHLKRGENAVI